MFVTAHVDWTSVLVAAIAAAPSTLLALGIRRRLHVPSGGTIGERVERTHELAAVAAVNLKKLNGGTEHGTSSDS